MGTFEVEGECISRRRRMHLHDIRRVAIRVRRRLCWASSSEGVTTHFSGKTEGACKGARSAGDDGHVVDAEELVHVSIKVVMRWTRQAVDVRKGRSGFCTTC